MTKDQQEIARLKRTICSNERALKHYTELWGMRNLALEVLFLQAEMEPMMPDTMRDKIRELRNTWRAEDHYQL